MGAGEHPDGEPVDREPVEDAAVEDGVGDGEPVEDDPVEGADVDVEIVPVAPATRRPGLHLALVGVLLGTAVLVALGRDDPAGSTGPGAVRVGDAGQVAGPAGTEPYSPGDTAGANGSAGSTGATAAGDTGPDDPAGGPLDGGAHLPSTGTTVAGAADTPPESDGPSRDLPEVQSDAPVEVTGPWAAVTATTAAGYVTTELGCASGTSAGALDAFFRERVGPVLGEDYQHVYPLGGNRSLWLFQDTFVDHTGLVTHLGKATFAHNVAMVQDGRCFTLYHRGTTGRPAAFEQGDGDSPLAKWFWPMGGELANGRLYVFWAEMRKDPYNPDPPDGLGWHPARTWLASYDPVTLQRLSFRTAPDASASPIYGYAVATQGDWTYLFGNTFEQNMLREGGYANGPHSATAVYLARVPRGQLGAAPEYRTADGWSGDRAQAVPIVSRFWVENPMQPRFLGGQWVSVAKVDGYWGEELVVDVAIDPWGPWTTVDRRGLSPRGGDPLMNTYHAHLLPWLDGGALVVSISQNARHMTRDAYPQPARYRIGFFSAALVPPPPPTTTTVEESTTTSDSTTSTSTSVDGSSTTAADTTTSTSVPVGTSTTSPEPSTTSVSTTTSTVASPSTTASTTLPGPTTSTTVAATTTSTVAPTTTG